MQNIDETSLCAAIKPTSYEVIFIDKKRKYIFLKNPITEKQKINKMSFSVCHFEFFFTDFFFGGGRDCPLAPRFHRPWRVKRRVVAWLVSAPALSRSLFGNLSKKKSPLQSTNSPRPYSSQSNAYHCQTEAKAIVSHSSDSAGILENPGTLYVLACRSKNSLANLRSENSEVRAVAFFNSALALFCSKWRGKLARFCANCSSRAMSLILKAPKLCQIGSFMQLE